MAYFLKYPRRLCLILTLAAISAVYGWGCQYGPLEPNRQKAIESREAWLETLTASRLEDEIFFTDNRGVVFPVIIRALPLTGPILTKSGELWPRDPRFQKEISDWTKNGQFAVLVGLYTPELVGDDDFLKNNPFIVSLKADQKIIAPIEVKIIAKNFLADYFPIFNKWEKVLIVTFPGPWSPTSSLSVSWPSGELELGPLTSALASGAK
ncbi:MAG: hypothetical protein LBE31_08835 [Deltaproteobacteria bacterium]|jgi:hypothetical protein|nr:hypothetical protein [Deltaproteobacteria bacterium]